MQAVVKERLPGPDCWVAEGDLRRLALDDASGRLSVCILQSDCREHWYDLLADAKCSLGAAEKSQRELHADLVRMLELHGPVPVPGVSVPITIWVGCYPAGVWGCAAQPYGLQSALQNWMN